MREKDLEYKEALKREQEKYYQLEETMKQLMLTKLKLIILYILNFYQD